MWISISNCLFVYVAEGMYVIDPLIIWVETVYIYIVYKLPVATYDIRLND